MLSSSLLLLAASSLVSAVPTPEAEAFAVPPGSSGPPGGFAIPLRHTRASIGREIAKRNGEIHDRIHLAEAWANCDRKYGGSGEGVTVFQNLLAKQLRKRQSITLQDHATDTTYSGEVNVGTPAQSFQIILDTGSADFWVEGDCQDCGNSFDHNTSSTYESLGRNFSVRYGSGNANGVLVKDTVSVGGFAVTGQTFALINDMTKGLITKATSGIMGFAFEQLSSSKSRPWWEQLASSDTWKEKLFAFYMKRWRDVPGAKAIEDGGLVTFGYTDSSLYTGDITYVDVAPDPRYWEVKLDAIKVQGTNIEVGAKNMVAVDTGTTLIGGPEETVVAFYAAIPGSRRMNGSLTNYFEYPCSTEVNSVMTFGGFDINIKNGDFNLGGYTKDAPDYCAGAVFIQNLNGRVQWILGATALKNAYTVFRYEPRSVGFANLPDGTSNPSQGATPSDANPSTDGNSASPTTGSPSSKPSSGMNANGMAMSNSTSGSDSNTANSAGKTIQAQDATSSGGADSSSAKNGPNSGAAGAHIPAILSLLAFTPLIVSFF